jgi:hypothetical protein
LNEDGDAVTPDGNPLIVTATTDANELVGATEIVTLWLCPLPIERLDADTEIEKSLAGGLGTDEPLPPPQAVTMPAIAPRTQMLGREN